MRSARIFLGIVGCTVAFGVQAATVSIVYTGNNQVANDGAVLVSDGDILTFTVVGDFTGPGERTIGGEYRMTWDAPRLDVQQVISLCPEGCSFLTPIVSDGTIDSLAYYLLGGFEGPVDMAVLTMVYHGSESITDTVLMTVAESAGPFVSTDYVTVLDVDYLGITLREVPVPGAIWLLFGGLATLINLRRVA